MSDRAQRPYLSAPDKAELPALTGLRALAALAVVGWHASGFLISVRFPFTHGYLGVDLFFILSGFIISYVYWQDFQPATGRRYLRFMALRLARLYPAHVAVLLAFCVLLAIAVSFGNRVVPDGLAREILAQLLLVHNWGVVERIRINVPSWSISAEFLAYLLFPLYVALFARLRSRRALVAAIVVAMGLCWFLLAVVLEWPVNTPGAPANIRVVCEFAVGVALFRLWQGGQMAHLPWTAIVAASVSAIALIVALTPPRHDLDYAIVLLMAPLILGLASGAGIFSRMLASRPMVYLGEISYSVYLVHALMILLVENAVIRFAAPEHFTEAARWAFSLSAIALSVLGGALLFHVVEKPARHWLRQRIDRRWPVSV